MRNSSKFILIPLLLVALVLSACGNQETPIPPTETPTLIPTIVPTATQS